MKHIFSFMAGFFVTLVMFGGWHGGVKYGRVDAEFAPVATAEVVFKDGTTANIVIMEVEITSITEVHNAPFEALMRNLASDFALVGGTRLQYMYVEVKPYLQDPFDTYTVIEDRGRYHRQPIRLSTRHSGISWTRRYLA